jgi:dTDP-4-amino-4,6-dideoxygalactose transaminase
MIPFNKPYLTGKETDYIHDAVHTGKISGNGKYAKLCQDYFENNYGFKKCYLPHLAPMHSKCALC